MSCSENDSRRRWLPHGLFLLLMGAFLLAALSRPVAAAEQPVSFVNDVVPVLTKAGCNVGVCHAKAGGGQKGFQLSLLGFEPQEDFEHLTKEGRNRRLFAGAPDRSLLLLKASGQMPHGGGVRLATSSEGYALLREWIRQGATMDGESVPKLVAFAVEPARGTIQRGAEQQLKAARQVFRTAVFATSPAWHYTRPTTKPWPT